MMRRFTFTAEHEAGGDFTGGVAISGHATIDTNDYPDEWAFVRSLLRKPGEWKCGVDMETTREVWKIIDVVECGGAITRHDRPFCPGCEDVCNACDGQGQVKRDDFSEGCNPPHAHDTDQRDQARALHRIVRAMHDGHCPKCGLLSRSDSFQVAGNHECPRCSFSISYPEQRAALALFQPLLKVSLDVFENWRAEQQLLSESKVEFDQARERTNSLGDQRRRD